MKLIARASVQHRVRYLLLARQYDGFCVLKETFVPTLPEFWMLQRYTHIYIWTARTPFQCLIVHILLTPFSSSVDITVESALKNSVLFCVLYLFVLCC